MPVKRADGLAHQDGVLTGDEPMLHPQPPLDRRRLLLAAAGACVLPAWAQGQRPPTQVEVWKDPSCGCCGDWVLHLQAHGMTVRVHDTGNAAMRARLGVAPAYGSCHTARVEGYAIEGHVPARDIRRLLAERPQAIGLAVPGMPVGSPGMDGPAYNGRQDRYEVLLLLPGGGARLWQRYG